MSISQRNWHDLPTPHQKEIIVDGPNKATFIYEPFKRGMGLTVGNAMRRVLLSSLDGAAATSMKISGVTHEFSHIEGVREDVIDIVLNMKKVVFTTQSRDVRRLSLSATGPCIVTAGMFKQYHDVEVVSRDAFICSIEKNVSLDIEVSVALGRGYVPVESMMKKEALGTIYLDSVFSPVRHVSFHVETARMGPQEFEQLHLSVTTNGAISPEEAIHKAYTILQDQMSSCFSDGVVPVIQVQEKKEEQKEEPKFDPIFLRRLDEFSNMPSRAFGCFKALNIVCIGDLVSKEESELLRVDNFGDRSLKDLKAFLSSMNLSFGMKIPNWPPKSIDFDRFAKMSLILEG